MSLDGSLVNSVSQIFEPPVCQGLTVTKDVGRSVSSSSKHIQFVRSFYVGEMLVGSSVTIHSSRDGCIKHVSCMCV